MIAKETKQQSLYCDLIQYIEDKNLKVGDRLPPERTLAEHYNTSRVTVRNVLNKLLHDDVLIRQQGRGTFIAPTKAKGSKARNRCVQYVGYSIGDSGIKPVSNGMIKHLSEHLTVLGRNINVNIMPFSMVFYDLIQSKVFDPSHVDGVIFSSYTPSDRELHFLKKHEIPVVVIGELPVESIHQVPCLTSNFSKGTFAAMRHLIELSHTEIALINGSHTYSYCREIDTGYCKGMKLITNVNKKDLLIETVGWERGNGYKAMNTLLDRNPNITAVVSYGDVSSIGALEAIKDRGLEVGDQISFVAVDYHSWMKNVASLPLTAVENPIDELAKKAIYLVSDLNTKNKMYRIPTRLVKRKSVMPRNII